VLCGDTEFVIRADVNIGYLSDATGNVNYLTGFM
jgi:hypothetical protein